MNRQTDSSQEQYLHTAGSGHSMKKALAAAGIVILCLILFLTVGCIGMKQTFAHRQTITLNSRAKQVYNAAVAYQQDLSAGSSGSRLQTTILNLNSDRTGSTLYQGIYRYTADVEKLSFAVICDGEGNVTGTMVSHGNIEETDLTNPQSFETQREYMRSVLHSKKAIGWCIGGRAAEPA